MHPRLRSVGPGLILCLAPLAFADSLAEPAPGTDLATLRAHQPTGWTDPKSIEDYETALARLIESDTLRTADDFKTAAALCNWGHDRFRIARSRYELLLAATALDPRQPDPALREAWDDLQLALAQPARFAATGYLAEHPGAVPLLRPPAAINRVWDDPAAARPPAEAADNTELKQLFDADQAVRQSDWSKLSQAELQAIGEADRRRNARALEIVSTGALRTGQDYLRAALLFQHSQDFTGYRLAHELAVAALLLAEPDARWLAAATYDRMLRSMGHAQRFGTQYGPTLKLQRLDESAFCDQQRLALNCSTLEAAKNRKW